MWVCGCREMRGGALTLPPHTWTLVEGRVEVKQAIDVIPWVYVFMAAEKVKYLHRQFHHLLTLSTIYCLTN